MVRSDGRNDAALAAALEAMAQAMQNQPNVDENAGTRSLATFQRENPPVFKGKYDPDGALGWLKEIERIFRVMDCTQAQKVRYGTHMLAEEADDWWLEVRQRLEDAGEEITWAVFKRESDGLATKRWVRMSVTQGEGISPHHVCSTLQDPLCLFLFYEMVCLLLNV